MQNTLHDLGHYEFVQASGIDTLSFLQGQLSCNTEALSSQQSLTGALCNLKGRVIADFRLVEHAEGCLLQCAQGMASVVLETLSKYAVFSKVELKILGDESEGRPRVLGLLGDDAESALTSLKIDPPQLENAVALSETCKIIRLAGPTQRFELWFTNAAAEAEYRSAAGLEAKRNLESWQRADIAAGIVHITPASTEEYTPQLLNYDISGLIDFKKGCYTGQEIVARMFYRSTAKKRMYLVSSTHAVSESAGVEIESALDSGTFEDGGSTILQSSNGEAPALMLAILPCAAIESGKKLRLSDNSESQLHIEKLPYEDKPLTSE